MSKKIFFPAILFACLSVNAQDSTKTAQLEEVVVTASRFQQKQSQTGKVVTVIDQKTLQRSAGRMLSEVLNYEAGVYINGANNVLGSNVEIYLRGSNHGKSLILVDGIPVNDPSLSNNGFDLNFIPVSLLHTCLFLVNLGFIIFLSF